MSIQEVEEELARIETERRRVKALAGGGRRSTLAVLAVAIGATLVECLICWLLWIEYRPLWIAPALHVAVCSAVALAAWHLKPNGGRSRFLALLALTLVFLGPFGPLGTMLAMLLHMFFRRRATPFDEWYQSLFPEEIDEPSRRLYEMLMRGLADSASQENVTSFTDVLQYGSIEQKRAVISLLSRDFRPEFAPALQSALSDANPAVRVQAATAAANIEGDFLERAIDLETAARKAPSSAETQFLVARHFDDYAFSGILDGDRQAENRRKAETFYRKTVELDPEHEDAALRVGRLLVRQGRLEEAEKWFEAGFTNGFVGPAQLSWYLEAAYRLGNYDKLRYAVAGFGEEILEHPSTSERLRDVVRLWLGHDLPPAPRAEDLKLA
ncbi:tetratricopeptide repeat protein [Minwuia sp.]|uniref:tetratricopeptide repeat protein n=1 Tax=Minwuia sp. TaxID=2493630 RepID=UPI003A93CF4C